MAACSHLDQIQRVRPSASECEACVREGLPRVHLRMCLSCGLVACCASSRGDHAHRHAEEVGHPIMRSIEFGEDWRWCYVDRMYV
jgi:monovalent cation/hydrogen antiporter